MKILESLCSKNGNSYIDYQDLSNTLGEKGGNLLIELVSEIVHLENNVCIKISELYDWKEDCSLVDKLEQKILSLKGKSDNLNKSISEKSEQKRCITENNSKVTSKELFKDNLAKIDELDKKIIEETRDLQKTNERIYVDESTAQLTRQIKNKHEGDIKELCRQYDDVRAMLVLAKEEVSGLNELFLRISSSRILKDYVQDADLLKKWLDSGKTAIILNFFIFFGCRSDGSSSESFEKRTFDLTSNDVSKLVPGKFIDSDALTSKPYSSNPYHHAYKVSHNFWEKRDYDPVKEGFSFRSDLVNDYYGCKMDPVWKEWTQGDEKIARAYVEKLKYESLSLKERTSKCCYANIKTDLKIKKIVFIFNS